MILGLEITENFKTPILLVFSWIVYTLLWITFVNAILLVYFWDVIRKKTGPTGLRGPRGNRGEIGIAGKCPNDATEIFLIKTLTEHIESLYKSKNKINDTDANNSENNSNNSNNTNNTNNNSSNDIINPSTNKFINTYLNNKINQMAISNQYKILVENSSNYGKPLENLTTYIKNIWTEWFNLIYNASNNGQWFLDETADENYEWSENQDPFTEIRKYDIYYWGITRSFRPLKAEVCRNISNTQNAAVPLINNKPRLKIIKTNNYHWVTDDNQSRGAPDAGWYRPMKVQMGEDTYYPVGDVMIYGSRNDVYPRSWNMKKGATIVDQLETNERIDNGYGINGPDIKTILVAGDVKPVSDYSDIIHALQASDNGIYGARPKCPEGYTSMGDVYLSARNINHNTPDNNLVCVPSDCVEPVKANPEVKWRTREGWPVVTLNNYEYGNLEPTGDNGYNLMRVESDYHEKMPLYKIKDKCLQDPDSKLLPPNKTFNEEQLAQGWYGTPFKNDPKYSIFAFLGIVPEGVITNALNGRKNYIVHYGGEDLNKFVIVSKNKKNNEFKSILEVGKGVSGDYSVNIIQLDKSDNDIRDFSKSENRQLWEIVFYNDKRYFFLKNLYNNNYLYTGLEPISGEQIFSTVKLSDPKANIASPPAPYNLLDVNVFKMSILYSFDSAFGVQLNLIDKPIGKKKQKS